MTLLRIVYLIAPLIVAGIVHAPLIKGNLCASLARPLDGGRTFRGRPIFGANKTWRGPLVMSAVSVAVVSLQRELYHLPAFRALSLVDYATTSPFGLGLALGLGYSLSELPNSFVKRQLAIPPGGISTRRALLQYVADQGDSALGGTAVLAFYLGGPVVRLLLVFAVGLGLHIAMDQLLYAFDVKRVAGPAARRPAGGESR